MLFKCPECGLRWFTMRSRQKCVDSHTAVRNQYDRFRRSVYDVLRRGELARTKSQCPPKPMPKTARRFDRADTPATRAGIEWPYDIPRSAIADDWEGGGGGYGGGAGASGSWDSGSTSSDSGGSSGGGSN